MHAAFRTAVFCRRNAACFLLSSFLPAFSVHLQTELLSLDKQKRKKNVFLVFFLSISRVLDTEIVTLRIILSL